MDDEEGFVIVASKENEPSREWNEQYYSTAQQIADRAVRNAGYTKAQVFTQGNEGSIKPLYVVEAIGQRISRKNYYNNV